jgi:glycosyltransferase involved in cell wall biosynthesis
LKASLVVTTLNESETIGELLEAIDSQTRVPDEVVLVDGGSSDETLDLLRQWAINRPWARVESAPGSNIAAGRNLGIRKAAGPIIAVTDAGCVPETDWLEKLLAGFAPETDVVMGFYRPDPRSGFEAILGCLNLPDPEEVEPERFMPSSRSVAFLKSSWSDAGGYPEWLDIGEDMYFNFRLRETGARRAFAPQAVVRWRLRPDLPSTLRQYFRYARGDAVGGMYPERHALRFLTYLAGAALVAAPSRGRRTMPVIVLIGLKRMLPAYTRAFRRLPPADAGRAVVMLPVLELLLDLAKMTGFLAGLSAAKARHRVRGPIST